MTLARNRPTRTLRNYGDYGVENAYADPIDRLFERLGAPVFGNGGEFASAYAYPFDLYETDEALVLEMSVPGLRAEDLEISIEGRQLTVRGAVPEGQDAEERRYWTRNIPRGEIGRTIRLPASVDTDGIQAHVHDGLLTLTMPKQQEAKAKRIQVTHE